MESFIQAGGGIDIVIDETLERRWGAKISKRGHYRDSALSSRKRSVSSPGLRWIVMAVVVTLPLDPATLGFALSVCPGNDPRSQREAGKTSQDRRHASTSDGKRGSRRWLPTVPIKLIGDTAYSILELGLHCVAQHVTLIAPFRLDSVIHQSPEVRTKHTIGRPRVVGKRLPSLETVLNDPKTVWQRITVDWYGEGKRALEICTATALWYRYGSDPLPIRWVLTRDPEGKRPPKALFSTDQSQTAEEIVLDFMKRWSLETTFEESHAHLGIETQRQWSDLAIERTTPLLFGLYSLVTLFGQALYPDGQLPLKQAAWYHKQAATFRDVLAVVRRQLWGNFTFPTSPTDPDVVLVPSSTLARLAHAVCY